MRSLVPRPMMLAIAVLAIIAAVSFIEFRFSVASGTDTQAQVASPDTEKTSQEQETAQTTRTAQPEKTEKSSAPATEKPANPEKPESSEEDQGKQEKKSTTESASSEESEPESDAERIARKEEEFDRAAEITDPTGYINTNGLSLEQARGEKVVLVEFWTYTCYNCQNAQPYINGYHEKYADDGLQVVGVHSPEFEFEKNYSNVAAAVRKAGIQHPVVLDNNHATWDAYNNLYWPAWYLIDSDGFVRYKHFGEGAYEETDEKIQKLLSERDRIQSS